MQKKISVNNPMFLIQVVLVLFFICNISYSQEDLRQYQHGIDFIKRSNGNYWLIWASSGNPPTGASNDGSWTHDIYYSEIDPSNPQINPVTIISKPEAQEPASSAVTSDGNIMITMEDGWNAANTLAQRYGVYNSSMDNVKPYPQVVLDGGHSGHVASVVNRFVVFYSEGWIDGGGVDNLGSGDDVMLKVYSSQGVYIGGRNVSVGDTYRDWWPMVAGSNSTVLLLWQRFVDRQIYADLMFSVYNPATGNLIKGNTKLIGKIKYYTYNAQYISSINRFLILGTYHDGGGFAFIVDEKGKKTAQNTNLPEIVREAQPAIQGKDNKAYAVYPTHPTGLAVLRLTDSTIVLNNTIPDTYLWSYGGTDGIFTAENSVYFVSLSKNGCREKPFKNIFTVTGNEKDGAPAVPKRLQLGQNYPNPFNPVTEIPYSLPSKMYVSIQVFDLDGELVRTLVQAEKTAGKHLARFNAGDLSSGVYMYRLVTKRGSVQTQKLLLLK